MESQDIFVDSDKKNVAEVAWIVLRRTWEIK